jgi:hypothetical protein
MGDFFSLGSRVLHLNTKPCSFGTTQTLSFSLVTYPLHAVTPQVSTNLGPVARLKGRGILDISIIWLSEAAIHQKNPKTVTIYVPTLGDTGYSENGFREEMPKVTHRCPILLRITPPYCIVSSVMFLM